METFFFFFLAFLPALNYSIYLETNFRVLSIWHSSLKDTQKLQTDAECRKTIFLKRILAVPIYVPLGDSPEALRKITNSFPEGQPTIPLLWYLGQTFN